MATKRSSATSAMQKLEQWFVTLTVAEQQVISELVRSALIQAADPRMDVMEREEDRRRATPSFVAGLTFQAAPELVQSIAGRANVTTPPPVYKTWGCSPVRPGPGDLVSKSRKR